MTHYITGGHICFILNIVSLIWRIIYVIGIHLPGKMVLTLKLDPETKS